MDLCSWVELLKNGLISEGDWGGVLQEIPQLNYTMKYVTTYLQEIPQRIR